jgi:hypothetical protein
MMRPSRRLLTQAPQDEVRRAMQQHEASSQLNDLASSLATSSSVSLILRRREAPSRRMGCTTMMRPSRRLLTQAPQDEVRRAMQQHEASSQLNDLTSPPSTVTFNLPHPEEARSAVSKDGLQKIGGETERQDMMQLRTCPRDFPKFLASLLADDSYIDVGRW